MNLCNGDKKLQAACTVGHKNQYCVFYCIVLYFALAAVF